MYKRQSQYARNRLHAFERDCRISCKRRGAAQRRASSQGIYYGSAEVAAQSLSLIHILPPLEELEADPGFRAWCGAALTEESEPIRRFQEAAAELSVGIVITAFTKGVKYPQNSAFVIGRDGQMCIRDSI